MPLVAVRFRGGNGLLTRTLTCKFIQTIINEVGTAIKDHAGPLMRVCTSCGEVWRACTLQAGAV